MGLTEIINMSGGKQGNSSATRQRKREERNKGVPYDGSKQPKKEDVEGASSEGEGCNNTQGGVGSQTYVFATDIYDMLSDPTIGVDEKRRRLIDAGLEMNIKHGNSEEHCAFIIKEMTKLNECIR